MMQAIMGEWGERHEVVGQSPHRDPGPRGTNATSDRRPIAEPM